MDRYRVKPGTRVDLSEWDPDGRDTWGGRKKEGREELETLNVRIRDLQELLYAEGKQKLLVVLQAMDTAGKDGVIKWVFRHVNPQGVKVGKFGKPTELELAHDYLWRVHPHAPASGEIAIFNRSHYEELLVVRVHSLVPEERWRRRYDHINAFEKLLADEGTTIRKFFLHISKDEQKSRLESRLAEPEKRWKFNPGDLKERALWPKYMEAYEEVLSRTSTEWAPWYVIPANRKWYRNLVVANVLIETLDRLEMRYPAEHEGLDDLVIE
jgi:PPK2 family polyphosphate:nucleotide phosphotransferase